MSATSIPSEAPVSLPACANPPEDGLDVVVLGLSLSSSWGNGHATTFRALLSAFARRGHRVTFLERDRPWYADNRDLPDPDWCRLAFYDGLGDLARHLPAIASADAVVVGSFVPDGIAVGALVQRQAAGVTVFYDIDTPVTLARLSRNECDYVDAATLARYDLCLSFSGGSSLEVLTSRYGVRMAAALHCSADTRRYRPLAVPRRWDLSYLGTYGADRQPALERLLLEPARRLPEMRFAVAGPQYPAGIDWPGNVERIEHAPPEAHAAFYSASRFTLNVTRADMVAAGHSPSVRLFEAGACGTAIVSDRWRGIEELFEPGRDIVLADGPDEVVALLRGGETEARRLGSAARRRVLAEHTADRRAEEFETLLRAAAGDGRQRPAAG